jgi:peptidoglycan/LPS O-acetylase OafA/YrhL
MMVRHSPVTALLFAAMVSTLFCTAYSYFDLADQLPHAHGGSPVFLSHLLIWVAGAYFAEVEFGRAPMPRGWLWTLVWVACLLAGIILQERGSYDWSPLPLAVGAFGLVAFALRTIPRAGLTCGSVGTALVGLGIISYSLYATHRISFGLIDYFDIGGRHASVLTALYCSAFAIGGAILVYWLVERHSIRR